MSEAATATDEGHQLPWRTPEVAVFKLQRRIRKASHAGDAPRVYSLQKRLLPSRAATLLAVRRVTQDNPGKPTAGVDGIKSLTPRARTTLADHRGQLPIGRPTRRVWLPQPGTDERRPRSMPPLHDRALQARVKLALEGEARCEPNSDGFRPGRSVHEAIGALFSAIAKHPK
jgi:RNA-directed DNA polymerase